MLRHLSRIARLGRLCHDIHAATGPTIHHRVIFQSRLAQAMLISNRATYATAPASPPPPSVETPSTASDPAYQRPIDPADERKLKILQLEVDVLRQEGRKVPAVMKPDHWEHLMGLQSKSARSKFYTFLWTVEKKRENEKLRKLQKREEGIALKAERNREHEEEKHIVYALSGTSYFLRFYETTMNHWHNNKLTRAMQFGQKLVIDCSYDEHMTKRECALTAKQLMLCFAENRYHDQPFDLHYCNANMAGHTMNYLQRHIPTMLDASFPLNVHTGSYLDHFPKEQLVYLTPHCNTDLEEYNPDHVYIIGAMVDTMHNEPLSLAKAKKLGLKMARLPLDRHLHWGAGSGKSLTLNQMTHIMLDLKTTGDWKQSLAHVPRRKLASEVDGRAEQEQRRKWARDVDRMKIGGGGDSWKERPRKQQQWSSESKPERTSTETVGPQVNKFRRKTGV